jgi:hypothetical protein
MTEKQLVALMAAILFTTGRYSEVGAVNLAEEFAARVRGHWPAADSDGQEGKDA